MGAQSLTLDRISSLVPLLRKRVNHYVQYLNKASLEQRAGEIAQQLEDPELWQAPEQAARLNKENRELQDRIHVAESLEKACEDIEVLDALLREEPVEDMASELEQAANRLDQRLERLEFEQKFQDEDDYRNAYMDIQSGSGGTEAQDWASMLQRMYLLWAEDRGYETEQVETSPGDVAGIKSATIKFQGALAYGYLKTETGIHRLVRKSPFDSGNRRHTSFASVYVYPHIDEKIEVHINPADLRIDTYRASGAGGQHVNRTDSAVRITHLPTGIVVQCQSDRSQHRNKAQAMSMLSARLYQKELTERRSAQQQEEKNKADIGWGQQIRSYVLDQSRIKDLRTGVESGDPQSVLNGKLDLFIEAALKQLGAHSHG